MITYDQILAANKGLTSIDVKGKDYIQVAERVKAFRKLFPSGFLVTKILSYENGIVVMEAEAGYYEGERRVVLANGLAYEKESSCAINKTSLIEVAQTSAVGRALGFLALGIDSGICSADELINAVNNQDSAVVPFKPSDLSDLRTRLEAAIKARTKDMSRDAKLKLINEVIAPNLNGERNWKLCDDPDLLANLLAALEKEAA